MSGQPSSRTDRILHALRDHPLIAGIVVVSVFLIGAGRTGDAIKTLDDLLRPQRVEMDRLYGRLGADLDVLSSRLSWLERTPPYVRAPSAEDSFAVVHALREAAAAARSVCGHNTALAELNDTVSLRRLRSICAFGKEFHRFDSADVIHRGVLNHNNILLLHVMAVGNGVLMKDSLGVLRARTWRP